MEIVKNTGEVEMLQTVSSPPPKKNRKKNPQKTRRKLLTEMGKTNERKKKKKFKSWADIEWGGGVFLLRSIRGTAYSFRTSWEVRDQTGGRLDGLDHRGF